LRGLARLADIRQAVLRGLARLADIRQRPFCETRQTRRHSPKAIFEKNVTHLAKFARLAPISRVAIA
jgi:hypothetical protein